MPVKIVAELSGSHNGSLERAIKLIHKAKKSGADALKLQTYTPDTLTVRGDHDSLTIKGGPWKGYKLWDLYAEAMTPWAWHPILFAEALRLGMECFSTPFDLTAVDYLEEIGCPIYKVSSFDVVNIPLLERIAATKKPVVISCGMASFTEIYEALRLFRQHVTVLHCVSEYPAKPEQMNMSHLGELRRWFMNWDCSIGLSDHSMTNTAAICAVSMGATMIEKHICLAREDGGPDSGFSLEPDEFAEMVRQVRVAEAACERREETAPTHQNLRPSLWVTKDVKPGDPVTLDSIAVRRPNAGLKPCEFRKAMNKTFRVFLKAPVPLQWEHLT